MSQRRTICIHEGGHAALAFRSGRAWVPSDGVVYATENDGGTPMICLGAEAEAIATLGGPIATKLLLGSEEGSINDYRQVTALANRSGGESVARGWTQRTCAYLAERSTRQAVLTIADALEAKGRLSGSDVRVILAPFLKQWFPEKDSSSRKVLRVVRHRTPPGGKSARGNFLSPPETKRFNVIKDGDRIIDYQNVRLSGYLSTFKSTTSEDRQGDYVEPGAFKETIGAFMKNPVLLVNHVQAVENVAGRFLELREDSRGLWFEAELSNSPTDFMRHVRSLVVEGHLKSVSIGGRFLYKEDGRGIVKVELFEGSLTPVPATLTRCLPPFEKRKKI